ncbi:MAG: hypothetical protein COB37_10000 [Kordiimonadales bacterium]|nr:MAG: hypothetical protein COB37_10000 [Kordiimonadales bacterium]
MRIILIAFASLLLLETNITSSKALDTPVTKSPRIEADYASAFKGLDLNDRQKESVRSFDEMVFGGEDARYFSLHNKAPKQDRFKVHYAGKLHPNEQLLSMNSRMFQFSGMDFVAQTVDMATADLLIIDRPEINARMLGYYQFELEIFLGRHLPNSLFANRNVLFDQLSISDNGNCAVWQVMEGFFIRKTIVMIKWSEENASSLDQQRAAVSCVNRGHYYAMGFRNTATMNATKFVKYREPKKSGAHGIFHQKFKYLPRLPFFARDGRFAGYSRTEILRALAEGYSRSTR